jgi:HEAT repeat protein
VAKVLREDASPNVRREAVRALAEFGPQPDILAALVDGVRDKHPSVRYNSHEMLRRLTKRDDVPRDAAAWEKVVGTR